MTDRDAFETRLQRRLVARAEIAVRPFDATAVARAAFGSSVATSRSSFTVGWRWILLAAGLAIAGTIAVLAAGGRLQRSHDAGMMAIARADGVHLVSSDGSGARVLLPGTSTAGPRWSPDGTMLAVTTAPAGGTGLVDRKLRDPRHVVILRVDGTVVARYDDVLDYWWGPRASIVLWRDAPPDSRLDLVFLAGERVDPILARLDGSNEVTALAWDPAGTQLLVALHDRSPSSPSEGTLRRWRPGPGVNPLDTVSFRDQRSIWGIGFSPDGTRIAYVTGSCPSATDPTPPCRYDLDLMTVPADALAGWDRSVLGTGIARELMAPAWSPDGRSVLFTDGAGRASILDVPSGAVREIAAGDGPDSDAAWSPDGLRVMVIRGPEHDVWTMSPDGSDATKLGSDVQGAAWRPSTPPAGGS